MKGDGDRKAHSGKSKLETICEAREHKIWSTLIPALPVRLLL